MNIMRVRSDEMEMKFAHERKMLGERILMRILKSRHS
jgi:hypothetical protein